MNYLHTHTILQEKKLNNFLMNPEYNKQQNICVLNFKWMLPVSYPRKHSPSPPSGINIYGHFKTTQSTQKSAKIFCFQLM